MFWRYAPGGFSRLADTDFYIRLTDVGGSWFGGYAVGPSRNFWIADHSELAAAPSAAGV